MIVRKQIDRPYWERILEKSFTSQLVNESDFKGCVSIIYMNKVSAPLIKTMLNKQYILADTDYYWLQFLPENENYSLTATYDSKGNIVQWYFDITLRNVIHNVSMPYFDDLFLDIVVIPGEQPFLIDEDDLEVALINRTITREEFNLAYKEANRLLSSLANDENSLYKLSKKYGEMMLNKIKKA